MRLKGKLIYWDDDKGFGFVEPLRGGNRAFVHVKSCHQCPRRPGGGDIIVYEQVVSGPGKFKAVNVHLGADNKAGLKTTSKPRNSGNGMVLFVCAFLTGLVILKLLPAAIAYFYLAASAIAYVLYAVDKSAARHNRWRTPESHLHIISLVGGWPGAFFAQKSLRHKSSKKEFKHMFRITIVINLIVLNGLFTEQGQQLLQTALG